MKGCVVIGAISLPYAPAGYMNRLLNSLFKSARRHTPVLNFDVVKLGPVKGLS
jgi:hypothetical protein